MAFRIPGSKSKWRPVSDFRIRALKVVIPVMTTAWMLILLLNSMGIKHQTEMEMDIRPIFSVEEEEPFTVKQIREIHHSAQPELDLLPRGIIQATSDMELRSLWAARSSQPKDYNDANKNLLAMPVGIKQKKHVDIVMKKFFAENFTIMLFHYDGNVDGWNDLEWHGKAIHIVANNQSKWWFAKRFLHPDVVSTYNYIFIWDEDLGVNNFNPGRYLKIVKAEGLEISQPALDPNSSEIHHRITMRSKSATVHRRVYGTSRGEKCSNASEGPPCSGWVEMMAPVFSRAAWRCTWHLIQNDLVHGWGLDMKLGYCAQGDRVEKVGVVDSEYVVHQGIQSLGGPGRKARITSPPPVDPSTRARITSPPPVDPSTRRRKQRPPLDVRVEIRRQSGAEWETFKRRWDKAAREDKDWSDPFSRVEGQRGKSNSMNLPSQQQTSLRPDRRQLPIRPTRKLIPRRERSQH